MFSLLLMIETPTTIKLASLTTQYLCDDVFGLESEFNIKLFQILGSVVLNCLLLKISYQIKLLF